MKYSQNLGRNLIIGGLVLAGIGLAGYKVISKGTEKDLGKTLSAPVPAKNTAPELQVEETQMINYTNIINHEDAEFLAKYKENGVHQAMIDLLANINDMEKSHRSIQQNIEGENLPNFIRDRIDEYIDQNHNILINKQATSASDSNPTGIAAFVDLTQGSGEDDSIKLIVFSLYNGKGIQKFTLKGKNSLVGEDGKAHPIKEIINERYLD